MTATEGIRMFDIGGAFVDGEWRPAERDERFDVICPSTERPAGVATNATPAQVDAAVAAAVRALNGPWRATTVSERAAIFGRVRDRLNERLEELATMHTAQMGAPITVARTFGVTRPLALLDSYLEASERLVLDERLGFSDGTTFVRRVPVGVVAAIVPWNAPLNFVLDKLTAPLLAGCTVVLKPAPEAPFEAATVAEILVELGVPPGVVNVVNGSVDVGEQLVRHPDVAKVTFTGSTVAGRRIGGICGESLKRMNLELGGKSAAIVLDDADLERSARTIAMSNFGNSGQACIALSRALVPSSRHDEFVDAFCDIASQLRIGDPFDPTTEMGPVVSERQRARVLGYIDAAVSDGARVAVGGGRPADLDVGWYVEPTVLTAVENSMRVARSEIFGPVISVLQYESVDEAISIANDSDYGLHGGVFTADVERGVAIAKRVETGTITINGWGNPSAAPFGGVKQSGVGREHGRLGIEGFLEYQSISVPAGALPSVSA